MKILHISDTHGVHEQLELEYFPILIHSGDHSNFPDVRGEEEFFKFVEWLAKQPHKYKIVVAWNHDWFCYKFPFEARKIFEDNNIIYLNKEEVSIDGKVFYGEPTTRKFGNWFFTVEGKDLKKHFELIPTYTDVLITHGPPYGHLDKAFCYNTGERISVGSSALQKRLNDLSNLKAVLFGHIHNNYSSGKGANINSGINIEDKVIYSNGSCVTDSILKYRITSHGNHIQI